MEIPDQMFQRLVDDLEKVCKAPTGAHLSVREVIDYVAGTLKDVDCSRVEEHVDRCLTCCEELEYFLENPETLKLPTTVETADATKLDSSVSTDVRRFLEDCGAIETGYGVPVSAFR